MTLAEAIEVAETIDRGIRDLATGHARFEPLWRHPFLREAFLDFLHASRGDCGYDYDHARANFTNVCALLAPEFRDVAKLIDHRDNDASVLTPDQRPGIRYAN